MNPLHYPDLERCKKLTEIGFPETDLFYSRWANKARVEYYINRKEYGNKEDRFLCPSVMEMLDVIPCTIVYKKHEKKETRYFRLEKENADEWEAKYNDVFHQTCTERMKWTLPNALADLIFWLVENKYLKFPL